MNKINLRAEVLLSLQRALLGAVTQNIRAVTCDWDEQNITIKAIFGVTPSEEEEEDLSCIETEVISDFPDHDIITKWVVFKAPTNVNPELLTACVYRRKEV